MGLRTHFNIHSNAGLKPFNPNGRDGQILVTYTSSQYSTVTYSVIKKKSYISYDEQKPEWVWLAADTKHSRHYWTGYDMCPYGCGIRAEHHEWLRGGWQKKKDGRWSKCSFVSGHAQLQPPHVGKIAEHIAAVWIKKIILLFWDQFMAIAIQGESHASLDSVHSLLFCSCEHLWSICGFRGQGGWT